MTGEELENLLAIIERRDWCDLDQTPEWYLVELAAEVRRLRQQIASHCDRIAAQAELLSKRAEK